MPKIINEVAHNIYNVYGVRRCSNYIKFNFAGNVKQEDCIFESKVLGIDSNKFLNTIIDEMIIILKKNITTDSVILGQKVIKFKRAWKVQGIDNTKDGLTILHCKVDVIGANDDLENEIADRWTYETKYNYSLEVTPTAIEIMKGQTSNISLVVK
ncbi:MAG: hypothetical protein RR912_03725 [Clostridium sp.]